MSEKEFSEDEIEAVIAYAEDEPTFATTAHAMLKQQTLRVKELEGLMSIHEERYQILKDLEQQGFQMVQTLQRERDEAVNQIYSALQFGYCHADLGWQGMMKIKESADYRKLFHSIFEPKNEVK